ncbi:MAG: hypothetical protein LBH37_00955 [Oscillospiraceae bacterium]|jgi:stage II sporulation protein M|nr:hypothetical protein [Oscillospiraceae bacterium]
MKGVVFIAKQNKKNKIKSFFGITRKNQIFSMMILFLLCGVIFGCIYIHDADDKVIKGLDLLFTTNLKKVSSGPFFETFVASLSSLFLFLMLEFFLGLSLWGGVLVPAVLFFRGFGIGFSAGYICMTYGAKGVGFYLLTLLPSCFVGAFSILLLARESIKFSLNIFSQVFPKVAVVPKRPYVNRLYFLRTGFCFILATLAAGIEVISSLIFGGLFTFANL